MKKSFKLLLIAVVAFLVMIPSALALSVEKIPTYKREKLEVALENTKIDYDFKHTYDKDHVQMYLFYGDGCQYCHNFLKFAASSLMEKYNDSLDIYVFEVWNNKDNADLYRGVAKQLEQEANGVPFIVVGQKSFSGYIDSYDEKIMAAIDEEIDSKDRIDVVEQYIDKYGFGQHFDEPEEPEEPEEPDSPPHYYGHDDPEFEIEYDDYDPFPVILFTLIIIVSIVAIPAVIILIIVIVVIILARNSSKKKNNTQ